jgi:hypothetical protein
VAWVTCTILKKIPPFVPVEIVFLAWTDFLTTLNLPIHQHTFFLHLYTSSLIAFSNMLFSVYWFCSNLTRFQIMYLVLLSIILFILILISIFVFQIHRNEAFWGYWLHLVTLLNLLLLPEAFIVNSLKCILQISIFFMNRNSLLLSVYSLAFCFSLFVVLSRTHSIIVNVSNLFIIDFFQY